LFDEDMGTSFGTLPNRTCDKHRTVNWSSTYIISIFFLLYPYFPLYLSSNDLLYYCSLKIFLIIQSPFSYCSLYDSFHSHLTHPMPTSPYLVQSPSSYYSLSWLMLCICCVSSYPYDSLLSFYFSPVFLWLILLPFISLYSLDDKPSTRFLITWLDSFTVSTQHWTQPLSMEMHRFPMAGIILNQWYTLVLSLWIGLSFVYKPLYLPRTTSKQFTL
jgi:hypothetical protein